MNPQTLTATNYQLSDTHKYPLLFAMSPQQLTATSLGATMSTSTHCNQLPTPYCQLSTTTTPIFDKLIPITLRFHIFAFPISSTPFVQTVIFVFVMTFCKNHNSYQHFAKIKVGEK